MKHLLRTATFLRPYAWQVTATMAILLTITGLNLLVPRIIQNVIDDGLMQGDTAYLVRAAFILLGLGLGSAFLNFLNRYLSAWIATKVGYDLRNRMYNCARSSWSDRSQPAPDPRIPSG